MKWYSKDGSPVTQVEKKGGGFTAPSIVHARKLGLIPDADDVLAVYHGSHIAAERITRAIDMAGLYPLTGDPSEWRRGIMAKVRKMEDDEYIANDEILGDVSAWCAQLKPSSVDGIAVCELLESFNPHKVELDVREHSWCSVRSDIVMRGCDADAVSSFGGSSTDVYAFIANGKQDAARMISLYAKASIINSIDNTYMVINIVDGDMHATTIDGGMLDKGSDVAAAARMLWSIEHDYIVTEDGQ